MRFFEAPDGHDEDCIWVENGPGTASAPVECVLRRHDLGFGTLHLWPHIVRALTAGPTLESARVVVDTLHKEVTELRRANDDLNRELTDLRRAHG